EPPLPKMTTPPLAEVHPPCVAPMRLANRPPQTVLRVRHRDQMRMIRHQAISPDFHATLLAPMTHQLQIGGVILLAKERRLPTVPALGNMMRHPGNNDTCQSSHAVNLAEQFAPVKSYVCCPPNSPAMLPPPAHDSGPGRVASPFPYDSLIRYSSPALIGAFSDPDPLSPGVDVNLQVHDSHEVA